MSNESRHCVIDWVGWGDWIYFHLLFSN
ncbi:uncharacterized protein METZ01_LOCUS243597 [marine metagenome]|uniref:Uncharacterized protein n=1 Tax=marine metagenome TaxID=408172 RepID=A0A382HVU0_9ZZZZ